MELLLLDKLLEAIDRNEAVALVTVVRATGHWADYLGRRLLVWTDRPPYDEANLSAHWPDLLADARRCLVERKSQLVRYTHPDSDIELFVEVQRRPPTLLIVGAGHVALPLAQLGKMIDFEVD